MKHLRLGKKRMLACVVLSCAACFAAGATTSPENDYEQGVQAYRQGDVVSAMTLLRKPADAGNAPAQVLLAYILNRSAFNEDALLYYRQAAQSGNADAQSGLAAMYAAGEGTERNYAEARKWFLRAAEQGQREAIVALAHAYMGAGLGITEDERGGREGMQWISRAAEQDYLPAVRYMADAYRAGSGVEKDTQRAQALDARAQKLSGTDKGRKGRK